MLLGQSSRFSITVDPVVVIPDILSKKASLNDKFNDDKTNGYKIASRKDKSWIFLEFSNTLNKKNFDNLIAEWSKEKPWYEINQENKRRLKASNSIEGEDVSL